MEIIFTNNAKDRSVYRYKKDFERILERACKVLDRKGDWSLSVIYVTPEQIHEINRDYRNVDRPTDVISFAIRDDEDDFISEEEKDLGDIFININYCKKQAKEYGHSYDREMGFLFTHGMLHCLGYDHMCEEDEKVMFALQDQILDPIISRK